MNIHVTPWRPIQRAVLPTRAATLARFLIGKLVIRRLPEGLAVGRIVETEAYLPDDPACHAFRGRTPRNASLFLRPGHAYVYVAYGTSMMLNVSAEPEGTGSGVLLRAMEPTLGITLMQARRPDSPPRDLARGPGRLAAALAIDRGLDGLDLCLPGDLFLAADHHLPPKIGKSTRIGLTKGADLVLRYYQRGSSWLSGPRSLSP
jgi:DNA-3-methyladenine glycosylase